MQISFQTFTGHVLSQRRASRRVLKRDVQGRFGVEQVRYGVGGLGKLACTRGRQREPMDHGLRDMN